MTDIHPKGKDNPRGLKDIPFALPEVTPAEKRLAKRIDAALQEGYPDAYCELEFSNPHELLIATILSAQSTDAGVNKATPELLRSSRPPRTMQSPSPEKIEPYIKTIGLFRNKAKSIHASMTMVRRRLRWRRSRAIWSTCSSCEASPARRPMSSSATPLASTMGSPSIPTCPTLGMAIRDHRRCQDKHGHHRKETDGHLPPRDTGLASDTSWSSTADTTAQQDPTASTIIRCA